MKTLTTKTAKLLALAIIPMSLLATANANEQLSAEQTGHLSYQVAGNPSKKVAIATTVLSRINQQQTSVQVKQIFANQEQDLIEAEYFFPAPQGATITHFAINNDYQLSASLPQKTVQLAKGDTVTINYSYQIDNQHKAAKMVMGFPQAVLPTESKKEVELIASK